MKPVYLNFFDNNILYHAGEAESKLKSIRVVYEKVDADVSHIKNVKIRQHPDGHDIYVVYLNLRESDRVDHSRMTTEQYLLLAPEELFIETIRYKNSSR